MSTSGSRLRIEAPYDFLNSVFNLRFARNCSCILSLLVAFLFSATRESVVEWPIMRVSSSSVFFFSFFFNLDHLP